MLRNFLVKKTVFVLETGFVKQPVFVVNFRKNKLVQQQNEITEELKSVTTKYEQLKKQYEEDIHSLQSENSSLKKKINDVSIFNFLFFNLRFQRRLPCLSLCLSVGSREIFLIFNYMLFLH